MDKNIIYVLIDPITKEWRYIGKSCRGRLRYSEHIKEAKSDKSNCDKDIWIRSLLVIGVKPIFDVIEVLDNKKSLFNAERLWIKFSRALGINLTNETDGGEGIDGHRAHLSTITRISGINNPMYGKKVIHSTETISKIINSHNKKDKNKNGISIIDENGIVYSSVKEAARKLNTAPESIRYVLNGKYHTSKGHTFNYVSKPETVTYRLFTDEKGNVYKSHKDAADKLGVKHKANITRCLLGDRLSTYGHIFRYLTEDEIALYNRTGVIC